jgi:hypothetical protein
MTSKPRPPSLVTAFRKLGEGLDELHRAAAERIKSGQWTTAHEQDLRWILEELPELATRIARWEKKAEIVKTRKAEAPRRRAAAQPSKPRSPSPS